MDETFINENGVYYYGGMLLPNSVLLLRDIGQYINKLDDINQCLYQKWYQRI